MNHKAEKKLFVIGIGPGAFEDMTLRAVNALKSCQLIVGYGVYVDLVRPYFPDKEYYVTPMRGEAKRCRYALEMAEKGIQTAVICSGDAGVYGMAGLVYELRGEKTQPEIEVISGLTAACSGAAILGAPLTHDFAVISLSDLLTEWETIEERLCCAAQAGLSIALYNPSSKNRHDYLQKACDIVMKYAEPERVCGVVKNIGREGQSFQVMTLTELRDYKADMFTTVFIGNPKTQNIGGKMVTPRGYHLEKNDNAGRKADV